MRRSRLQLGFVFPLLFGLPASAANFEAIGDVAYLSGVANAGVIDGIAVVPASNGQTIFVASKHGGIWRSLDGGTSWDTRTDTFPSLLMTALAVDATGSRVYATSTEPVRLLRSLDGGNNFSELTIPQLAYSGDRVNRLILDPDHPGTLYATSRRGLLRSQDDGVSWQTVVDADTAVVADAALLTGAQHWLLVSKAGLLYRSASGDPGSFSLVPLPAPGDGQPPYSGSFPSLAMAGIPDDPGRIFIAYAGSGDAVYRSDDYGASAVWTGRHPGLIIARSFAAGADGSTIYTGELYSGNAQLNRSTDAGASWDYPFPGPYHPDVSSLTSTASPNELWVGTDGGLWKLRENTQKWSELNGNMQNLLLYHAYASRSNSNVICGGTQDNGAIVYRGVDWVRAGGGDVGDCFMRSDDPNLGGAFTIISGSTLLEIIGNQASINIYDPPPLCEVPGAGRFGLDPDHPKRICVARGSVVCSNNGGKPEWCFESADFGASNLVMQDASNGWASASDGRVWRTTSGPTGPWVDATGDLPLGLIRDITASPSDPLRALVLLAASGADTMIYETLDGGTSWAAQGVSPTPGGQIGLPVPCISLPCSELPVSLPGATSFDVIFPGALVFETWLVGTERGLFESGDGGANWLQINLPNVRVTDVSVTGSVATIATYGRGVWQRDSLLTPPPDSWVAWDPFWWLKHSPVEDELLWASQLVAQSRGLREVRQVVGDGLVFRKRDAAFGPSDFAITPGIPFLTRGRRSQALQVSGRLGESRPIALDAGWNAVGILAPGIGSASDLVADAATQGIVVDRVTDGGAVKTYVAAGRAPGDAGDFPISATEGYWVHVVREGIWTPGGRGGSAPPPAESLVDCRITCRPDGSQPGVSVATCGECRAAALAECPGKARVRCSGAPPPRTLQLPQCRDPAGRGRGGTLPP